MVSIRLRNDWRSVSRALVLHDLYRHYVRYNFLYAFLYPGSGLTSAGPRFALVGLFYLLTRRSDSKLPGFVASMGLLRTLTCGGWTYITSTDDHDWHDILMISYIVCTLPWTLGCIALSPPNPRAIKYRKYLGGAFFGTLVPLVYFFIQHKVHRVAGGTSLLFSWPPSLDETNTMRGSVYDLCVLRVGTHSIRCWF